MAPLRYIREAALRCPLPEGTAPVPRPTEATVRADEAANQLGRILNNLRQLVRVAELDGDRGGAAVLLDAAGQVEEAVLRLPTVLRRDTADALASLVEAGIGLNALAHRAKGTEQLPSKVDIEASLRRQEQDEGLRVVPGWLAPVPGAPELRPRPRLARADQEFLREVEERAGPVLERAQSWSEAEAGLTEFGLRVRVNGRGMSVTDGQRKVKASEISRYVSRFQLKKRLGRYSDYRLRRAVASEIMGQARTDAPGDAPPTQRTNFLSEVRGKATSVLRMADSWADLEHGLGELGLSLRVKGGGFVVTGGQREVKASEVGREFSRAYLEKRLGRYPQPGAATPPLTAPAPESPPTRPS